MLYLTFSYAHKSILLLDLLNFYNLAIGSFFLLNKIGLFLLLLTLMFAFVWALFSTFVSCNLLGWLYILLITLRGDVERNPRPKRNAPQTLSICHWNLNSTCAYNFASLKSLCECTEIWYNLLIRDMSWFQCWWWKRGNLRILFNMLWSPIQQISFWYLYEL